MPTLETTDSKQGLPLGTMHALGQAMTSWRTASVALLSFSSGLPLGLVWISLPYWMSTTGYDIRVIGLTTLAHAPWTFKMLWSPLMDRFTPPFMGRRRGWILLTQVALFALTLALAGVAGEPEAPWIILALTLALAFAAASQDIVIDAYAVDVLRPEERGVAVGARTAVYRGAMFAAGSLAITATAWFSWKAVCAGLALLYLPMAYVTLRSPEPEVEIVPPMSLRESIWLPFLGFLTRHRALEILAFVLSFKLADMLAQSLMRPFFDQMGYNAWDIGVAVGTVGLWATIVGTFLGGAWTTVIGLGRCLWIFGLLQIFSNVGYILVANSTVNRPLLYGAITFEMAVSGASMGAFGVLLLRLTQKRFSATQYALFSSLFALPRLAGGPLTGFIVHAVGWTWFFWFTMLAGVPGLVLLARFAPWSVRDPQFPIEPPRRAEPLSTPGLVLRGLAGGLAGLALAGGTVALLRALEAWKDTPEAGLALAPQLVALAVPSGGKGWLTWLGLAIFAAVCGLITAAVAAARHGAGAGTLDVDDSGGART